MATKRKPSVTDGVQLFREIVNRSKLHQFRFVNRDLICRTNKDLKLLFHFDQTLWNALMEDEIAKSFTELDITKDDDRSSMEMTAYTEKQNGWIDIAAEDMYSGKVLDIAIEGFDYQIQIGKSIFPIRFKKAEYNNFAYRVDYDPRRLTVRKIFPGTVEDSSFMVLRVFNVV